MRLIDVDKLLEQLDDDIKITSEFVKKSIKYDDYRDFDKSFAILYMLKSYRAIVEDMKTAFDVEKVLSELEDLKEENFKRGIKENEPALLYASSCLHEALDIVKAGGVDES